MIKLIIFDLDGTLADTSQDLADALNYAVKPFGLPPLDVETVKSMVGEGLTKLVGKAAPGSSDDVRSKIIELFLLYYGEHIADHTRLYPDVDTTLEKLYACKKAVVSNKREALSEKLLKKLGIARYFEGLLGGDSMKEKKPSPAPIVNMMERFGASPEETVIVGDSPYDIQAGKAAGVKTVAVTYGFRDKSLLMDADRITDSFARLPELIESFRKEPPG